jgi:hypothetical protein
VVIKLAWLCCRGNGTASNELLDNLLLSSRFTAGQPESSPEDNLQIDEYISLAFLAALSHLSSHFNLYCPLGFFFHTQPYGAMLELVNGPPVVSESDNAVAALSHDSDESSLYSPTASQGFRCFSFVVPWVIQYSALHSSVSDRHLQLCDAAAHVSSDV